MAYITIDDLKTLVPMQMMLELSDDDPSFGSGAIDSDKVNATIREACEEVDGYLRGRYRLPFAKTPTLVTQAAKQIARYMLYERRPEGFELPPAVIEGRKIAVRNLEKIRDGLVTLGVPEGELLAGRQIADDGEFAVRVRPSRHNQSTFSKDLLDQY